MKATTRVDLVLIFVGLMVVLSFPGLTGADGGGANVIRDFDCTISLEEPGGGEVTTTDTQSVETPSGNVMMECRADLPDYLDPPARALRTTSEECETPLGVTTDTKKVITPAGKVRLTCLINRGSPPNAVGWAVGDTVDGYGVIIHTTDGGQTWVRQGEAGEIPDVDLSNVAAIDAQNAWVVGFKADGYGVILRTRNGGRTWQRQGSPDELADYSLWGVYALDRKTAWVTGYPGVILHTTDGGLTWTRQEQDVAPEAELSGIYASDADHVWVVGPNDPTFGVILHTEDGGANWHKVYNPCEEDWDCGWLIWPHGVDDNTVWISGNGVVMHTADGGLSWVNQTPHGINDFNGLFVVDRNTIWTVLDPADIFHSDNGGETWERQVDDQSQRWMGVSAVDRQTAWVVGSHNLPSDKPPGKVLFTEDGGETWTPQTTPVDTGWSGVSFVR